MAVVAEAKSWIGTPYHHMARVKGVGCDCLTLLAAVYHKAGVIPTIEIPYYPPDWHLHRSAERYLYGLLQYACELRPKLIGHYCPIARHFPDGDPRGNCLCGDDDRSPNSCGLGQPRYEPVAPEPGDVALFRFGRCFSHGSIVTEWPQLIHAWHAGGVIQSDAAQPLFVNRPVRYFSPFCSTEVEKS